MYLVAAVRFFPLRRLIGTPCRHCCWQRSLLDRSVGPGGDLCLVSFFAQVCWTSLLSDQSVESVCWKTCLLNRNLLEWTTSCWQIGLLHHSRLLWTSLLADLLDDSRLLDEIDGRPVLLLDQYQGIYYVGSV